MVAEKQTYDYILAKIGDRKPLPPWYKNIRNSSVVASITFLYLSSLIFMIWWEYDVFEKTRLCKFEACGIENYIFGPANEYAIISILLGSLVYTLYRSTDWPLVKDRLLIIFILVLIGAGLSGSGVVWLKAAHDPISDGVYDIKEIVKTNIPWRYQTQENMTRQPKSIVGVVENSTINTLVIKMPLKQRISLIYDQTYLEKLKPKEGSRVLVQIKLVDKTLFAQSVEIL
jgi:hypothetical protein